MKRLYQVGISKSSTVPQLAEAVIIDRNSKEHPQNEINQKVLSQLKKHLINCQTRPSSKLCMFTGSGTKSPRKKAPQILNLTLSLT